MPGKKSVSVTLSSQNLLWLHGQVVLSKARGVSEVLDELVAMARARDYLGDGSSFRSLRGTIRISPADPDLSSAEALTESIIRESIDRPVNSGLMNKKSRTRKSRLTRV